MAILGVITSPYGPRKITVNGKAQNWPHRGQDRRSAEGTPVVALFSGVVTKVQGGRVQGAPIGRADRNGTPPLTSSMSGNGVIVRRADGRGYYIEMHCAPSVAAGQTVVAGTTVLGHTDLSGGITAAHRHIELWRQYNPSTYYDPAADIAAAVDAIEHTKAPVTPAPTTPTDEDDDMTPEQAQLLQQTATKVGILYEAIFNGSKANGQTYPAIVEALRTAPNATAGATWGAWFGRGDGRRTAATVLAQAAGDIETVVEVVTEEQSDE